MPSRQANLNPLLHGVIEVLFKTCLKLLLDNVFLSFHLDGISKCEHGGKIVRISIAHINKICDLTKVLGVLVNFVKSAGSFVGVPHMSFIDCDNTFHVLAPHGQLIVQLSLPLLYLAL